MVPSSVQTPPSSLATLPAAGGAIEIDTLDFLETANRQLLHRVTLVAFAANLLLSITLVIVFVLNNNPAINAITGISVISTTCFGIGWLLSHRLLLWQAIIWEVTTLALASLVIGVVFPEIDFMLGLGSSALICIAGISNNRWLTIAVGVVCILGSLIAFTHPLPATMTFSLGIVVLPLKAILATAILLNSWLIYDQITKVQQTALRLAESRAIEARSARNEAEAARAEVERLQQAEQQRLLALVETLELPILPVGENILVVPLVGDLDSHRAARIQQRLLEAVAQQQIRVVVIDVTSVSVLDTMVAQQLLQIAQSVRLLGAKIVVSGISARLAQTLVALGVAFDDLETPGNLGQALAAIQSRN